jgi:protein O-mannosyl-transferase
MTHLPTHNKEYNSVRVAVVSLFLVLATFVAYSQVLDHGFIHFDDNKYLTNNWNVKSGFTSESMIWSFTTSHASNWHPVTWLSHILDFKLYGLDPSGHHLTNLFFHIANTLLLFGVLLKMTGALWRSGLVAALFSIHPLNVESVVWIAERKNVLSTFFWFLTLWAYAHYVEKKRIGNYLLVVLFLALGLMSKPMLVTLPFVLLLLDFWPLKRWSGTGTHKETLTRLIIEKIPLFILVAGSSVITYMVQKGGGAMRSTEFSSFYFRIANALVSYLEYLGKMVWPQGLSIFYPHPGDTLSAGKVLLCALVLVGITLWVVREIQRAPYLAVGWFWYLGTLVPVIGIVQVGGQAMADRYMYVPLIGIFIAIAWGLPELMKNGKQKFLPIIAGLVIPLLMALTWTQVNRWENSITLFKHAISVTDHRYRGIATTHALLGNAYHKQGEFTLAVSEFKKSLQLNPDHLYSYNNLAATLAEQGNLEEAQHTAQKLVSLNPDYTPGLVTLGKILEQLERLNEAQIIYRRVLELGSSSFENHLNLANTLYRMGNHVEAVPFYKKAIILNPRLVEAHYNLGNSLGQQGHLEEAQKAFEQAIRLDEKLPLPHYGLGIAHLRAGQYSKAIKAFEQALTLNPKLEQAHHFLAEANDKIGQK